jgi:2-keto-4-pentenoate hydratase/2-oxohepta-3-ene-1,7-dioic acid hydratase in catechol pathway
MARLWQNISRMRLATTKTGGTETAAIVLLEGVLPVAGVNAAYGTDWPTDLFALLANGGAHDFQSWFQGLDAAVAEDLGGWVISPDRIEYAPPYRRPRKIWGIGLNYVEHAEDLSENAPVEEPASFMRPDTTIIGPGDQIKLPAQSNRVTGEAELAVVIGRKAKNVPVEEAPSVIAGFTTVLDMTAEDILRKNPRYLTRSKSFDTFFSFGPHLAMTDEVGDVDELEVATVLNGDVRRRNTISNMTFSPWELIAFHSRIMTLLPGDIISTGTPGAVEIREGDVLECRITGFEPLINPVTGG